MAKNDRNWHPNFLEYMEWIAGHPNYRGLPIERKKDGALQWVATAQTETGQKRIEWVTEKAKEYGYPAVPGFYADVMLEIHPTKWKVCQTCGRCMSLYYCYPNKRFLDALEQEFGERFTDCDHISAIWDILVYSGVPKGHLAQFFILRGGLPLDWRVAQKEEILAALEYACRKGGKKCLGPGAMSDFPDRFDGFHSYNRCCRNTQDTGRSKENLKSYTKDRRAYEYWSDGNIHAANQFMGSSFFAGTSADHIGPISLGFVHDPRYLQPMPSGDNSSKRDRLQFADIAHILEVEERTGVYPMSWQSKLIWEHIRIHYKANPDKVPTIYRNALKQNMANYMSLLHCILKYCPNNGMGFLIKAFLEPHFESFQYTYGFNARGDIINYRPRHYTGRNENEIGRYVRIAIQSVYEYNEKDNRSNRPDLTPSETGMLQNICSHIEFMPDFIANKQEVTRLVETIERRILSSL